jgi:hypothetical protein
MITLCRFTPGDVMTKRHLDIVHQNLLSIRFKAYKDRE